MIYKKYIGLHPISFKVAAFLLAGIEDDNDPAVYAHFMKLVEAAREGQLEYVQKYKKVKRRRVINPGIKSWVEGGPVRSQRTDAITDTEFDWVNSTVFRKDVDNLYRKDNENFRCDGISSIEVKSNKSESQKSSEDNQAQNITNRHNQKSNTLIRNKKIQELVDELAKEKIKNSDYFTKDNLYPELSSRPELIGISGPNFSRIVRVTWKRKKR